MKPSVLFISCEHAVDNVPQAYQSLFAPFKELIASHRGIDFGALAIANYLKDYFQCELIQAQATRFLVDCNRTIKNAYCFSEVTRDLPAATKQHILNDYYIPFREQVLTHISALVKANIQVWHLSIHSFTPVLHEQIRTAEIGLLYDPRRITEKKLAGLWQQEMRKLAPAYRVRLNYPYKGISDGFTSTLRKLFSVDEYIGIEVEVNQELTFNDQSLDRVKIILATSLAKTRGINLMLS